MTKEDFYGEVTTQCWDACKDLQPEGYDLFNIEGVINQMFDNEESVEDACMKLVAYIEDRLG